MAAEAPLLFSRSDAVGPPKTALTAGYRTVPEIGPFRHRSVSIIGVVMRHSLAASCHPSGLFLAMWMGMGNLCQKHIECLLVVFASHLKAKKGGI